MQKILTICLNPVIQKTLLFDNFKLNNVNRTDNYYTDASGKGVNVTRVLIQLGANVTHLTHLGGYNKKHFLKLLNKDHIKIEYVNSKSQIRSCYTVIDTSNKSTTELVEEAKTVNSSCEKRLLKKFSKVVNNFDVIVISGSKAEGYSDDIIPHIVKISKQLDKLVILDIKGKDLLHSLPFKPDIVKHNKQEFEDSFSENLNPDDIMLQYPYTKFIVTDGIKPVLVLDNGLKTEVGINSSDKIVNTTGCGDSFTSGITFSFSQDLNLDNAIKLGIKCGKLNAQSRRPGNIKDDI